MPKHSQPACYIKKKPPKRLNRSLSCEILLHAAFVSADFSFASCIKILTNVMRSARNRLCFWVMLLYNAACVSATLIYTGDWGLLTKWSLLFCFFKRLDTITVFSFDNHCRVPEMKVHIELCENQTLLFSLGNWLERWANDVLITYRLICIYIYISEETELNVCFIKVLDW